MSRLFWKILLTFWSVVLVLVVTVSTPFVLQQYRLSTLEEDIVVLPLSIMTINAASSTLQYGGVAALKQFLTEQQDAPDAMQLYVLNGEHQELLNRPVDSLLVAKVTQYNQDQLAFPAIRQVDYKNQTYYLFAPWSGQFAEFNQKRPIRLTKKYTDELALVIGILIASFLASLFLAQYFSRPVAILKQAFAELAQGEVSFKVAKKIGKRRDELADLGTHFDKMALQLQQLLQTQRHLVEAQQHLLHDVAHELRSPLTRLAMSIAIARQQPHQAESSLERIESEAERLSYLVNEVLTLARLESISAVEPDFIDIVELIKTVVETAQFEAQALGLNIILVNQVHSESLIIGGNGELLYRALENILRNAIQYTKPSTTITVILSTLTNSNHIQIEIQDQGNGVAEQELELLFNTFYRGLSTQSKGFGLGLAIAKRAILFHQGTITAHNRAEGGLSVLIQLPSQTLPSHAD